MRQQLQPHTEMQQLCCYKAYIVAFFRLGFEKTIIFLSSSFMIIWRSNMRITNVASDLPAGGKIKMPDRH